MSIKLGSTLRLCASSAGARKRFTDPLSANVG